MRAQKYRVQFLLALYKLPSALKSIPINQLIPIAGTPLQDATPPDAFEFIKTIAVARLMFPKSRIRLSAGREHMSDEMQAWCFMAGANSMFIGDKLLMTKNPSIDHDSELLHRLKLGNIPKSQKSSKEIKISLLPRGVV